MTNDELSEMEKYKSALWVNNLLSPSADGLICKLIAEVRQANASREEVVGLLKKCLRYSLSMPNVATVAEGEKSSLRLSNLSRQEARRILEIVEGK